MAYMSAIKDAIKSTDSALAKGSGHLYGAEDQVHSLKRKLVCMQDHLRQVDGVPKRARTDGQLPILTDRIHELAFRAEDAMDAYDADMVDNKNLFSKFLGLRHPVHALTKKIKAIQQELEEAKKNFELFGFPNASHQQQQRHGSDIGSSSFRPMPENYLHLDDEVVVGIEGDVTQLVELLTNSEHDFKVLAIVGTGGAGKTTLASQIYRHDKVQRWFSHRAFISISQKWHLTDLLQRIAREVMGTSEVPSSQDVLVKELHHFMRDRQCLVVLDDIWHKEAWDAIRPILPSTKGSRVMLTTRIEEVPRHADPKCLFHEPLLLKEDQRWELFRKIAIQGRDNIEGNFEFERLGKQMSENCRGLPLEVVTLAGILRSKQQVYEWEIIHEACVEKILKGKQGNYGVVEDMLELSYLELPSHLKPCFLYLAIIPEDWMFPSSLFNQLLIAEGFISSDLQQGSETLEDVAMWSLDELAQRYIIKVVRRDSVGQINLFRVHDLMREFCIRKANEDNFLTIDPITCPNKTESSHQPRRISFHHGKYWPPQNHHLRSIVYFGQYGTKLEGWKLMEIHSRFKLLRVLSLNWVDVALTTEIGNLTQLKYLQLCLHDSVLKLPDSVKNLGKLSHFQVFSPRELEVPEELVSKMENLRVLDFRMAMKSTTCPKYGPNSLGLSSPKNMIKLSCTVGKWVAQDLPTSSPTLQRLGLRGSLQKTEEMAAVYQCPSILNGHLRALKAEHYPFFSVLKFDLRKLRHCTKFQDLKLHCPLTRNCMASTIQFLPNLVSLTLYGSEIGENINLMEVLGKLQRLKCLNLHGEVFHRRQISCSRTAFPQLQGLWLDALPNLTEWRMEKGAMARLQKLMIDDCYKLKRLPECIRFITTLKELSLSRMSGKFCRRLGYDSDGKPTGDGEDSYIIRHIPDVNFYCF